MLGAKEIPCVFKIEMPRLHLGSLWPAPGGGLLLPPHAGTVYSVWLDVTACEHTLHRPPPCLVALREASTEGSICLLECREFRGRHEIRRLGGKRNRGSEDFCDRLALSHLRTSRMCLYTKTAFYPILPTVTVLQEKPQCPTRKL